jgi:hypothetical protein
LVGACDRAGRFIEDSVSPADTDAVFAMNYWLNNFRTLATDARRINAYDVMWPYVERCRSEGGRLPNYVTVNFYDQGDVFRVVDRLNGFG